MKEQLLATSTTDKMRIYFVEGSKFPYELRVNSLSDGDPVYGYKTYRGACIAMSKFQKGRYKGNASTAW